MSNTSISSGKESHIACDALEKVFACQLFRKTNTNLVEQLLLN